MKFSIYDTDVILHIPGSRGEGSGGGNGKGSSASSGWGSSIYIGGNYGERGHGEGSGDGSGNGIGQGYVAGTAFEYGSRITRPFFRGFN